MAIKALVATLILGTSSLALAQPGYGREVRAEHRVQQDRAELRRDEFRGDRAGVRMDRRELRRDVRSEHRIERNRRFNRWERLRGWRR